MTISDVMFTLDEDLAKYKDAGPARDIVLRRALRAVYADGWQQGCRDGMADGRDRRKPSRAEGGGAVLSGGPTLLDLVRVLSDTYTDEGVLLWLFSANKGLTASPGGPPRTPAGFIVAGLIGEVYAVAERIEGGG